MDTALPERTRIYQNHHLDSTRWERFAPRDDDIVIATSYKSGTTHPDRLRPRAVPTLRRSGAFAGLRLLARARAPFAHDLTR